VASSILGASKTGVAGVTPVSPGRRATPRAVDWRIITNALTEVDYRESRHRAGNPEIEAIQEYPDAAQLRAQNLAVRIQEPGYG
jgi:hypothetical protein